MIRIRLRRKLALSMNGVDVSRLHVGDILELADDRANNEANRSRFVRRSEIIGSIER